MISDAAHAGTTSASAISAVCSVQPSRYRAKTAAATRRVMPLPLLVAKVRSLALFSSISSRMMLDSCPVTEAKSAPMLGRASPVACVLPEVFVVSTGGGGYCPGWGEG